MTTDIIDSAAQPAPASPVTPAPALPSAAEPPASDLGPAPAEPSPEPVNGPLLLHELRSLFQRFVVLPQWAPETLALWTLHTYAAHLRDTSAYLGIESPVKRCGKTTLLAVLAELVHRPVLAANISPSAFFRVIQQLRPTLLIDEADTVLRSNDELRGILNAGYKRDTAYVVRVDTSRSSRPRASSSLSAVASAKADSSPSSSSSSSSSSSLPVLRSFSEGGSDFRPPPSDFRPPPSALARFSTWCPKAIAAIGHLPDTLADRCILIRMHRKSPREQCERFRHLHASPLRSQCARFALDHATAIAAAQPSLPRELNDRAADIWEPLLALADLAGADWPALARQAASALALNAQDNNPIGSLLLDIFVLFTEAGTDRLPSRALLEGLSSMPDRPWSALKTAKHLSERWLADRLRELNIRPRLLRLDNSIARGYLLDEFHDVFRRYISQSDLAELQATSLPLPDSAPAPRHQSNPDPAQVTLPPPPVTLQCNALDPNNPSVLPSL